jgi:phosphate:Na+ symporter
MLAALGKPPEAQRVAVVHLTFNILGALLWLPLIPMLARLAEAFSPASTGLEGMARMAADVPRQIANANTLFNVLNTAFFIGLTGPFARLAEWLVPDRAAPPGVIITPKFLDDAALAAPSLALQRVRFELGRAGEIALEMLEQIGPAIRERDHVRIAAIAARDDEVDILEAAILEYLGRIRQGLLTEVESVEHQHLMAATVNLESLADVIETDLVQIVQRAGEARAEPDVAPMLVGLYDTVCRAVSAAVRAVRDNDQQAAQEALSLQELVREQSEQVLAAESAQLRADRPDYVQVVRLQSTFVEKMRHIYTLARRIAKGTLPPVLAAQG